MIELSSYRAAILMSAHGNCPYFADQVASIVSQMGSQDILVIVDDGSGSVPWLTIREWPICFLVWTRLESVGTSHSFFELIEQAEVNADCYFLADQDDLWHPEKLILQVTAQAQNPRGLHASAHAWTCMQNDGVGAAHSQGAQPTLPLKRLSKANFCFETPAPGMTLSFSAGSRQMIVAFFPALRALLDFLPHDRILFALLSAHMDIHVLTKPLVSYRQHANNLVGAPSASVWKKWFKRLAWPSRSLRTVVDGYELYQVILTTCADKVEPTVAHIRDLKGMRLRTSGFENSIFHALLACRCELARRAHR